MNTPIHIYINRINNSLVFKIRDGYKFELQMSETMTLLGSTNKLLGEMKYGENVPGFEVAEVVLVQSKLVVDQYRQNFEVLYTFTPNKSYSHLLNVEPSNLVFLKTYKTEVDEFIITFANQNEIES